MALEGIAWVPDTYLTAHGFKDQATNATYNPATYANHGTGLFFVGVEQTGDVYAYALDLTSNSYTRVAKFASGFPSVMDLTYEPGTQKLWVVCDDTCGGRTAQFQVNGSGAFSSIAPLRAARRSRTTSTTRGSPSPRRASAWAAASRSSTPTTATTAGHVIRVGTLSCAVPTHHRCGHLEQGQDRGRLVRRAGHGLVHLHAGPLPLGRCLPGGRHPLDLRRQPDGDAFGVRHRRRQRTATVSGINIDLVAPTVTITGVKKGKTYPKKKKPKCVGTDALSGIASCTVTQKKKGSKYKVTATATDKAGNVTVVDADLQGEGQEELAPVTLAGSGADQSVTRSVSAEDGGTASVTLGDIDIDLAGPYRGRRGCEGRQDLPSSSTRPAWQRRPVRPRRTAPSRRRRTGKSVLGHGHCDRPGRQRHHDDADLQGQEEAQLT